MQVTSKMNPILSKPDCSQGLPSIHLEAQTETCHKPGYVKTQVLKGKAKVKQPPEFNFSVRQYDQIKDCPL